MACGVLPLSFGSGGASGLGVRASAPPPTSKLFWAPSGALLKPWLRSGASKHGSYLVDSASSHMLVSKIKPCMSKYKQSIR